MLVAVLTGIAIMIMSMIMINSGATMIVRTLGGHGRTSPIGCL